MPKDVFNTAKLKDKNTCCIEKSTSATKKSALYESRYLCQWLMACSDQRKSHAFTQ